MRYLGIIHQKETDMKRLILALALVGAAGAAHAQMTYPSEPPKGRVLTDENGKRVDATGAHIDHNGNRVIGSDTWTYGPGDRGSNIPASPSTVAPPQVGQATPPIRSPQVRDEYGFRYDSQGNRIDARGNLVSPQTKSP